MNYSDLHSLAPAGEDWAAPPPQSGITAAASDDRDEFLPQMIEALSAQMCVDGLRVRWHPPEGDPRPLFTGGKCRADAACIRFIDDFTAQLADRALGGGQPLSGEASCPSGRLAALAFPSTNGVVTVTSLMDQIESVASAQPRPALFRLLPVLRPFIGLWAAMKQQRSRFASLTCAVDNCDIAMFLVDRSSKVLFANKAAERFYAQRSGLSLTRGRLSGASLSDTLRLQAAIDHVCSSERLPGTVLPIVSLQRADGRALMITAVPVQGEGDQQDERSAILYAFDPEEDLTPLIEPACRFYGLSAGETRLACRLASGGSLAEAARALGVREQTARSYLKQIFLKTQTNRQAELVWLMLKSAVRVTNAARMRVF